MITWKKYAAVMLVAVMTTSRALAGLWDDPLNPYGDFEDAYQSLVDSMHLAGAAVAIVVDNDIVYTGGFGKRDIAKDLPVTDDTYFRVMSISKTFVATALMQLHEQGLIDISADINQYLPFTLRNPRFPDVPITIEMMMSHTAGINDSQAGSGSFDPINPAVSHRHVARCYNTYPPGTAFEYCNYSYNILGCVIEYVTGQRWYEYIKENIMDPLGLDADYNVSTLDPHRIGMLYNYTSKGYVARPDAYRAKAANPYRLCVDTPRFVPASGLKITAPSLARFMLMHMNYGLSPICDKRIISEESSRRMQTVLTDNLRAASGAHQHAGPGLMRTDEYTPGTMLVGHIGEAYGLYAAMFFNPDEKYGFVVICNGTPSRSVLRNSLSLMLEYFISSPDP